MNDPFLMLMDEGQVAPPPQKQLNPLSYDIVYGLEHDNDEDHEPEDANEDLVLTSLPRGEDEILEEISFQTHEREEDKSLRLADNYLAQTLAHPKTFELTEEMARNRDRPRFFKNNEGASTVAVGFIGDLETRLAYYVSHVGPQNAIGSLWATLLKAKYVGQASFQLDANWTTRLFIGEPRMKKFMSPLPQTAWYHSVFVGSANNIIILNHEDGMHLMDLKNLLVRSLRQKLRVSMTEEAAKQLAAMINAHTNIPIPEEWAMPMWEYFVRRHNIMDDEPTSRQLFGSPIRPLFSAGDAVGAWSVNLSADWLNLLTLMHREGFISLQMHEEGESES